MSARNTRPNRGDLVTPDMSMRDIASALGISLPEMCRWKALARIPEDEFESRLAAHHLHDQRLTASSVVAMSGPVPARGRVERASAIYISMTPVERTRFLTQIGGQHG